MKMHRSFTIFSISHLIVILSFFIAAPAHAVKKDPVITAVTVTNESSIIVDVIGTNFTRGKAAPIVTLGGQVMAIDVGTLLDTFVSASLPTAFPPGDYLLTVTHAKGVGQYDLTVSAPGALSAPRLNVVRVQAGVILTSGAGSNDVATVICPAGTIVVGGGFDVFGGEATELYFGLSAPFIHTTPSQSGWVARGRYANQGVAGRPNTVPLTVVALCANISVDP